MAREGTRSATGNSKPRVFSVPDTAPTFTRTRAPGSGKRKTKTPKVPTAAKPKGVTKKKAPAKKSASASTKVSPVNSCASLRHTVSPFPLPSFNAAQALVRNVLRHILPLTFLNSN